MNWLVKYTIKLDSSKKTWGENYPGVQEPLIAKLGTTRIRIREKLVNVGFILANRNLQKQTAKLKKCYLRLL